MFLFLFFGWWTFSKHLDAPLDDSTKIVCIVFNQRIFLQLKHKNIEKGKKEKTTENEAKGKII